MRSPWHLGNDIVDLGDPRHRGKAGDTRFLERVFSKEEQADIGSAHDSDEALWLRWAGKEAAFKTISKALGAPPTFVHSDFQVVALETGGPPLNGGDTPTPPMTRFGEVQYQDRFIPIRIELVGTALHAVSWEPRENGQIPPFFWGSISVVQRAPDWKEALRPRFSSLEWGCISHQASALARLAARKSMASVLGVEEGELEIRCGAGTPGRRIPSVFLSGVEYGVDLTLSHHGDLLAWAFLTAQ
jgi:phosphopantetheine--protein transferase-like protein